MHKLGNQFKTQRGYCYVCLDFACVYRLLILLYFVPLSFVIVDILLSVVVAFLGHTKRSQAELDVSLKYQLILYSNESCFLFGC